MIVPNELALVFRKHREPVSRTAASFAPFGKQVFAHDALPSARAEWVREHATPTRWTPCRGWNRPAGSKATCTANRRA